MNTESPSEQHPRTTTDQSSQSRLDNDWRQLAKGSYRTAGWLFVGGWLGCLILGVPTVRFILGGLSELLGFVAYLCAPLPLVPVFFVVCGLICQLIAAFQQRSTTR